ncbi:hypothetical protein [Paraburkholderia sp. C35]|uniref:hypothetical protein n=1 Tax=Paraburkholderia sp. C35 TaxID=2126993 RepID=UPI0013A55FBA|nr:hypothetical protein [Paraburkholderia sp. C35]
MARKIKGLAVDCMRIGQLDRSASQRPAVVGNVYLQIQQRALRARIERHRENGMHKRKRPAQAGRFS